VSHENCKTKKSAHSTGLCSVREFKSYSFGVDAEELFTLLKWTEGTLALLNPCEDMKERTDDRRMLRSGPVDTKREKRRHFKKLFKAEFEGQAGPWGAFAFQNR
jgi:hypothetical protein